MSKLGKDIISALKEAKKKGLVTLQTSPDVGKLRKKLEKDNRKYIKNGMTHIDWEALREEKNTVKKPKKVVIIYQDKDGNHRKDEYMDSPQKRRREKLLGDNDNSTCTTEFFKQSYKQSADIVEKLQKKYWKR